MGKFKGAIRQYCQSKGKSCVIFERNFRSQHLQLQVGMEYSWVCVCYYLLH